MADVLLRAVVERIEDTFGRARLDLEGYHWRVPVPGGRGRSIEVVVRGIDGCEWVDLTILDERGDIERLGHAATISITVRDDEAVGGVVEMVRQCAGA